MVKSTLREIRTSLARYLAIFAIVALGVGFFSGLKICRDCMVKTASDYLSEKNFYDYQINSSYGIDEESIKIAENWNGVSEAEGSIRKDVLVKAGEGTSKALRAISMPENINELDLVDGRLPEKAEECVIDAYSMTESGFSIGDTLTVTDENDKDRLKDFKVREFKIVGTVNTPLYLDYQRGFTDIGNGSLSAFFFIEKDAFTVDYYTDMYVRLNTVKDYFSNDVENAIADVLDEEKKNAEDLSEAVTAARRESEQNKAQEELDENRKEYEEGLAEYEENKAEAEDEFARAEKKIDDGQKEIDRNRKVAEAGRLEALEALKELNVRMSEVNEGIKRLKSEKHDAESGLAKAEEISEQLAEARTGVEEQTATLRQMAEEAAVQKEALEKQIADLDGQIDALRGQAAELEGQKAELVGRIAELGEQIAILRQMEEDEEDPVRKEELKKQIEALEGQASELEGQAAGLGEQITGIEGQIAELETMTAGLRQKAEEIAVQTEEIEKQIAGLELQAAALDEQINGVNAEIKKINEGIVLIDSNLKKAENGKTQIKDGMTQADNGLKQAEKGIARLGEAQKELDAGREELAYQRRSAEEQFAEAAQQLEEVNEVLKEAQQKIDDMAAGDSYAVPATKNAGYSSFDSNSNIVSRVAVVFPVFFFLIAALVCMTTMTRMIDEQRGQVGILKALGYSNAAIAGKYLFYSGSAAFLGAVVGFFAGCRIFPVVIWKAYSMMYGISDDIAYVIDWKLFFVSLSAALICSMGATWAAIAADFRVAPAELIRPKNPPAGKRILLEYITPLWNRISFLYKVSVRNIFRDKKRFVMMVLGISGCTALLIAAAGIGTTVAKIADHQFEEISLYDYMVVFSRDMGSEDQKDFEKELASSGEAADVMYMHQGEVTIETDKEDAEVTCIAASAGDFGKYVDLHAGDMPIEFPAAGEVVIVKRLMRDFGIQEGDEIVIRDGWREMKVKVSAVCDNYINDMIYMSPETYRQGFGVKPDMNAAYVKLGEGADEDAVRTSATAAAGWEDTAAVQLSQDVKDNVADMMKSLDEVVIVIMLSAALLAFIVIYNLTNINITERTREIATIKVLGFRRMEVNKYVFRENLFMTAAAVIVGVPLGKLLLSFAMDNIMIKMLCFETKLSGTDIVQAVILTFVFALLVGVAMQKRLRDVSMTESLKSVE